MQNHANVNLNQPMHLVSPPNQYLSFLRFRTEYLRFTLVSNRCLTDM